MGLFNKSRNFTKRQKISHRKSLIWSTIFLSISLVLSNVLGLLRDRIFVWRFGAGSELDSYYAAFRIPDLIFNLLVLGALFSAFIPVFTNYLAQKEEKEAWHVVNSLINISTLVLIIIGGLCFIAAPYLVLVIAPGFSSSVTKMQMTINLTRLMLITPIIFCLSNVFSGVLNSFKRFVAYALTPVVYNLGIIFGALYLTKFYGIYGLALGVVLGALLHLGIQLPSIWRVGYRYRPILDFTHPGFKQIIKLMIPTAIALGISQIVLIVYTGLGSILRVGTIAIINLTNNIQTFPTVVFGIAIATTIFPHLAEKASLEKINDFVKDFSWALRQILFLIIPSTAGMILLRAQIIRLILGAAKFTWADTQLAASTLAFFVLSLVAQASIPLLARAFYAFKDTKTPLLASFWGALVNILTALFFSFYFFGYDYGAKGLALAYSLGAFTQIGILWILLRRRVGFLDEKRIFLAIIKISLASFIMACAVYGTLYLVAPLVNMQRFVGILIQTICAILVGVIIYLLLALLLKCEEIKVVRKLLRLSSKD